MTRHAINYDTHEYLCGSTHGEMADFNIDTTCADCADSIRDGGPGGHVPGFIASPTANLDTTPTNEDPTTQVGYYESLADEGEGLWLRINGSEILFLMTHVLDS